MKHNEQNQRENTHPESNISKDSSYSTWILLVFILAITTFLRLRLISTPLERDEGEYAYMGQLLLQGVPPYQEAFNMKLPGTNMMYALFMLLFGQTVSAIHLGLLIVNTASIVLLFVLTRRWFGAGAGAVAALSFSMITLSPALLGFAAHATHFVVLFALGGLVLLIPALERKKSNWVFISGILFGCAFLMKQPGIFFFLFGSSIILFDRIMERISKKEFFRFSAFLLVGFLIPILAVLAIIISGGTFNRFWFWIVDYASTYGFITQLKEGMQNLRYIAHLIWTTLPLLCIFSGAGFILIIAGRFHHETIIKLMLFELFSFLALFPGWYFRHHYFILIAPVCSMFIGAAFYLFQNALSQRTGWKYLPLLVIMGMICENALSNRQYYFFDSPVDVVKKAYFGTFIESSAIGEFIAIHTTPSDRIAVLGSEPQIYFYARRRSASGYLYMYTLMEVQPFARTMQDELISDIEIRKPKCIVFYSALYSWLTKIGSETQIFSWINTYIPKNYSLIGVVELSDQYEPHYALGKEFQKYVSIPGDKVLIYERININHKLNPLQN